MRNHLEWKVGVHPKRNWSNQISRFGPNLAKNNSHFRQIILIAIFTVITFSLLSIAVLHPVRIIAGKPSPITVKAPKVVAYIDDEATKQQREKKANEVQRVYQFNPAVKDNVIKNIDKFFKKIIFAKSSGTRDVKFDKYFPQDIVDETLTLENNRIENLNQSVTKLTQRLLGERIVDDELAAVRIFIPKQVALSGLSGSDRTIASEVIKFYIQPNYIYDAKQTSAARKIAASDVKPVISKKIPGEIIVRDGEVVTKRQERVLNDLRIFRNKITPYKIFGVLLLVLTMITMLSFFVAKYHKKIFNRPHLVLLFELILLVNMIIAYLISPSLSIYLIPIQATAMLVAILLSQSLAVVGVVYISLFTGILTGNYSYVVYGAMSGLFAILFTSRISSRQNIATSSTYSAITSAIVTLAIGFSSGSSVVSTFSNAGWSLAGGGFAGILTIGLLGFLEPAFGITTDMRLLELVNPNHPLLKELMLKTPGTYNHSIIVGNMVEAAATDVGANQLLARAGAYYHDIGKTKRPQMFIENKFDQVNGHDKLSPNLSCKVITAHVTEGLALAQKHRLPKEVCEIIQQHHGTSVVSYFYEKAKQKISKESINEEDFRYPGKLPQSREAALVMLADALEAASRSLAKPSINRIKQISKKIIDLKLKDGQLDESDLTLGDLKKITDSFAATLSSIYHTRIEYPESNPDEFIDSSVITSIFADKSFNITNME